MAGQSSNPALSWDVLWASCHPCTAAEGRQTLGVGQGRLHSPCLLLGFGSSSAGRSCQQLAQSTRTLEQPSGSVWLLILGPPPSVRIPMPPAKEVKVWGLSLGEWNTWLSYVWVAEWKPLNKIGKGEVLNQAILEILWEGWRGCSAHSQRQNSSTTTHAQPCDPELPQGATQTSFSSALGSAWGTVCSQVSKGEQEEKTEFKGTWITLWAKLASWCCGEQD